MLFKAYKNGLALDYTEHRLGSLTHQNLFNLMGSLYKHDVCKPDYVDHGMDKIEDPRLKSMILSSLTNTDSRWIIAYTRYTRFLHTIYGWLLMNAYTRNLPDRDLHEFRSFPTT
jgi:hypothetical protein